MKVKKPKRWNEIIPRLSDRATMVEVGTWKGDNAFRILDRRPDVRLILVDPWVSGLVDEGLMKWIESGSTMATRNQAEVEAIYRSVMESAKAHGERCRVMRMKSIEAAPLIPDLSIDMVFIDAIHTYEAVREDIRAWIAKVKPGGYIGGHDFGQERFPGVQQAVEEMFPAGVEIGVDHTWFRRIGGAQ